MRVCQILYPGPQFYLCPEAARRAARFSCCMPPLEDQDCVAAEFLAGDQRVCCEDQCAVASEPYDEAVVVAVAALPSAVVAAAAPSEEALLPAHVAVRLRFQHETRRFL